MTILNDKDIRKLCAPPDFIKENLSADRVAIRSTTLDEQLNFRGMIYPYTDHQVRKNGLARLISHGQSSFGYDVMLKPDIDIFTNEAGGEIDPKSHNPQHFRKARIHFSPEGDYILLPPNSYALGCTHETFDIPKDVMVIAVGKSTYARAGILINVTPIEAGFKGQVVIEIANGTSLPARIYVNEGIAQFIFFRGESCGTSYADRNGKYQGQTGITHAKA